MHPVLASWEENRITTHTRLTNTQGHISESNNIFIFWPLNMTLVFFIFTLNPSFSKLIFQDVTVQQSSSTDLSIITRSSIYSNTQGHAVLNSWDNASRTMTKRSGLRTDPCCTPAFAQKLLLKQLYPYTLYYLHCDTWPGQARWSICQLLVCS